MTQALLQAAATMLLADLVSGFVHWLEDAYARPGTPLLGTLAADNLRHHWRPREFLANSWFKSSWDLLLAGVLVVGGAAAFDALTWHVVLFASLIANANQIHKWAHMNRTEVPRIAYWLQRAYVLQTPRHHTRHHGGTRTTHYCVITNFLNPLLEEVGFWKRIEVAIERTTGIKRRDEAKELALLGMPPRATLRRGCVLCRVEAS